MLEGFAGRHDKDSNEYEKTGGKRQTERKKSKPKTRKISSDTPSDF